MFLIILLSKERFNFGSLVIDKSLLIFFSYIGKLSIYVSRTVDIERLSMGFLLFFLWFYIVWFYIVWFLTDSIVL